MALVSVIVPAYNAERFIEGTLRSALGQTHGELEILVVNDGSTDETGRIVESLAAKDARIRQIVGPNSGVAHARNLGIQESHADFLAFLDADDLWHPTKIELQLKALNGANGDDFAASYALHRTIDEFDRVIAHPRAVACSGYILSRHLFKKFVGNGSSILVRRRAALAVGGFDASYRDKGIGGCEDLDFELKLAARYELVAIPQHLVGHRQYLGNMSSNRDQMARALLATTLNHVAANPALPSHACRYALAASHEWAGRQLRAAGSYRAALQSLSMVLVLDPLRGLNIAVSGLVKLAYALVGLLPFSHPSPALLSFYAMNPAQSVKGPNALERRRLEQLTKVDALLDKRRRQSGAWANGHTR